MLLPSPTTLTFVALIFLLAGFVKGVIGMGLPTVAVGLLGLVMRPAEAAALLIIPSLVTNFWQLAAGPWLLPLLRRLWSMLLGICLGTLAGSAMLGAVPAKAAHAGLGAALLLYAILRLRAPRPGVPARLEPALSPLIGAMTGLVTGATGVLVVPAVPYLQALALERDVLVQALGLSFTVSTLALAGGLACGGMLAGSALLLSLLALAPALIGMGLGQWARARLDAGAFGRWFFLGLTVLGGELLVQGAW